MSNKEACKPDRGGQHDDPELAIIATQLRATAEYAIAPAFKEKLREELLWQFRLEMMR